MSLVLAAGLHAQLPQRAPYAPSQEGAVVAFRYTGELDTFRPGVTLFTDRGFVLKECPSGLEGMPFYRSTIEGSMSKIECDGKLLALTPQQVPGASSQVADLEAKGFTRLDDDTFQLFNTEAFNRVYLYAKDVKAGEQYYFGKFTVFLGLKDAIDWPQRTTRWEDNTGELLYNGIRLPEEWPPRDVDIKDMKPMAIPYLEHRPEVVPIDLGRQLLVDDFLIENTTLTRHFHHPKKYVGNPVLKPETPLEINETRVAPVFRGKPGAPFAAPKSGGVWWDPEKQVFKMWYEAGWLNTIALATSTDGITWERPEFDVRPGTNQVLPVDLTPDSWTVVRNWDSDNPEEKYTLYICAPGPDHNSTSLTSPDGIHWTRRTMAGVTGDRSTHFYNPFRKKWVYSLRTGFSNRGRARHYYEADDFMKDALWSSGDKVAWLMTDENDPTDYLTREAPQLYNFDAVAYESLMLGMFEVHQGPNNQICNDVGLPKITELQFAYSRDGFHWDRPDRSIAICAERKDVWDRGYVQSIGNVCVINGDELWFYYSGVQGNPAKAKYEWMQDGGMYSHGATGLAILRRDGFASMETSGDEIGELLTRPVSFSGSNLFVNLDAPDGWLRAEIQDLDGQPIAPFTLDNCIPVTGDHTLTAVNWRNSDISSLAGRPVRIRFELDNGALYAFWVSRDATGRSDGYLAGGGPGYTGPTDTVGREARSPAND